MKRIEALEAIARDMVGDGQTPDVFFVSDEGRIVAIETDAQRAYDRWRELAARSPRKESALENRTYGVLASVEPKDDSPNARLVVLDDFQGFASAA